MRHIARPKNLSGYLKLIQMVFITSLLFLFGLSFVYFWINDENQVSPITVIFTVIVGWIGFILARFFGEKAMEVTTEQQISVEELQDTISNRKNQINESEIRENESQDIMTKYEERTDYLMNYIETKKKSRRK